MPAEQAPKSISFPSIRAVPEGIRGTHRIVRLHYSPVPSSELPNLSQTELDVYHSESRDKGRQEQVLVYLRPESPKPESVVPLQDNSSHFIARIKRLVPQRR